MKKINNEHLLKVNQWNLLTKSETVMNIILIDT